MRLIFLALIMSGCTHVEWAGNPAVRTGDAWISNVGWLPDYEIGMRSDGVVVWRKVIPKGGTDK